MAIIYDQSISNQILLSLYNNQIIRFHSDNASPAVKASLAIGAYTLTITPNTSGVFTFNFKEVIKVISDNKFKDTVANVLGAFIDINIVISVVVTITITHADTSTFTPILGDNYIFYRGVEQIGYLKNYNKDTNNLLVNNNLTFFNGYPFDISYYADGINATILTSSVNNYTLTIHSYYSNDVYRVFLSSLNGDVLSSFKARVIAGSGIYEENICADNFTFGALEVGFNTLTLTTFIILSLNVWLKDQICDSTYLKWVNRYGTYSYWLFSPVYNEKIKSKTVGEYNADFASLIDTTETSLITGKTSTKTRNLIAEGLTDDERLQVIDIFTSPRVEMYTGAYKKAGIFQVVKLKDGNLKTVNVKHKKYNIKLSIEINDYTQI